ncbi:MAG: ComEC/Rec2 family competence protein [Candidatus Kapabacteria bacterium]|jgi:ComEC/Rec2-related protein|nr:ComEC/Rec2 family competence protein [Candidatus Kapabacteria bacterium]
MLVPPAKPHPTSLREYPAVKMLCVCALGFGVEQIVPIPATALLYGVLGVLLFGALVLRSLGKKLQNRQTALSRTTNLRIATKHSNAFLQASYAGMALALGALLSHEASQSRIEPSTGIVAPSNAAYKPLPPMPAVVCGQVERIVKRDSASALLLVRGVIDAKALPRLTETGVLLRVRAKNSVTKPDTKRPTARLSTARLSTARLSLPASSQGEGLATNTQPDIYPHLSDLHPGSSIYAVVQAQFPKPALLPTDIDEQRYTAAQGASFLAFTDTHSLAITADNLTANAVFAQFASMVESRIYQLFPAETASFALALVTGNTAHLPPETLHAYSRTGTVHVLAVSGLHIVLLLSLTLVPLGFVRFVWLQWVLAVVVIGAFIGMTGGLPSALRSGLMASLVLLANTVQRRINLLNVAALSVLLLLVWQPTLVFSAGFQMSVGAVVGIALTLGRFEQGFLRLLGVERLEFAREYPVRKSLATALAITCAASVIVAPLVAWYFGKVSLIGILSNLIIVPLSSAAMLYTLVALLVSVLWQGGAELFAQTAHQCLRWMNVANEFAAMPRFAAVHGRWAFPVALLLSSSLVYCFWTPLRKVILARFVAVVAATALFAGLLIQSDAWEGSDQSVRNTAQILPREQVVALVIPSKPHATLLLQDRRIFQGNEARNDAGLERYIAEYALGAEDSLTVCTTGVASMLIANGIARRLRDTLSRTFAPKPPLMRVLATSLLYKSPRFFAAMDSLEAHGIKILAAQRVFSTNSTLTLLSSKRDVVRLSWDVWRNRLCVGAVGGDTCFVLPQMLEEVRLGEKNPNFR